MTQQNGNGEYDPAAATGHFQRFVQDNNEPEAPARRPVLPIVLGIVAAVALVVVILIVVLALL